MAKPGETEVFSLTLKVGKCYEYAEATREGRGSEGTMRYFTTNPMQYVGRFVRTEQTEEENGGQLRSIFIDNNGMEHRVYYPYGGNTPYGGTPCFREVPCKEEMIKASRNVWSSKTETSGEPGSGPANIIAKFLGGSRRLRNSRRSRKNSTSKKSRKYRKNRK
jgi:hypothetical protein